MVHRDTGVEPRDCLDRRLIQPVISSHPRAAVVRVRENAEVFDVDLIDPPEAAEFAFGAVEISVVVQNVLEKVVPRQSSTALMRVTTCTGNGSRVTQGRPASRSSR